VSSAILYVAIVAIWACVLIPRWLRRDSARGAGSTADTPVPGDVVPGDVVSGNVVPAEDAADDDWPRTAEPASNVRVRYTETWRADVTVEAEADLAPEELPVPDAGRRVPPRRPEESRRRMLAARRRLLGMLIILEIAAGALAALKLAALWVLIPPSIMLIGYLLLLREASHADAERAQREEREEEAARARIRAQERARERAAQRAAAAPATPAAPPVPAAPPAPAARYEDAGRDFAPGLAGKYTTSHAESASRSDEDYRDEYAQRLRAVGD
jgi:hypothetical protein